MARKKNQKQAGATFDLKAFGEVWAAVGFMLLVCAALVGLMIGFSTMFGKDWGVPVLFGTGALVVSLLRGFKVIS